MMSSASRDNSFFFDNKSSIVVFQFSLCQMNYPKYCTLLLRYDIFASYQIESGCIFLTIRLITESSTEVYKFLWLCGHFFMRIFVNECIIFFISVRLFLNVKPRKVSGCTTFLSVSLKFFLFKYFN